MSQIGRKPDAQSEELDAAMLESLAEAFLPSSLDLDLNQRLIEQALFQPAAPPIPLDAHASGCSNREPSEVIARTSVEDPVSSSLAEQEEAEELAGALAGEVHHPLAELAETLRAAYAPSAIADAVASDLTQRALHTQARAEIVPIRAWSYAASALAVAAGIALWIAPTNAPETHRAAAATTQLARSRSLSPLFAETFEHATPTQRIDRIYAVRSRELRQNRFAAWRVR